MKYYRERNTNAITTLVVSLLLIVSLNGQTNENKKEDTLPPKKEGVKRIGVLLPKVSLNNVSKKVDPAIAVRNTFATLLNSKSIELVPLDARLNALAFREALDKECDLVLKISLTQKQNKKGGGFLNRILDKTADSAIRESTSKIPAGNNVGGSVGREAAVGAGQEVTEVEFTIKKKDQFILDYELSTTKAKSVIKNSLKATAKKNNDDVLMPLIEKAANEIANFLLL